MKENFHGSGIRASEFVTFSQLSQFDPVDYVHGSSTSKWMHQPESVLPAGVALPMMRRRKNRGKGETEELKKEQEQDRHIAEILQTLSVRVSYCRPAKTGDAGPGVEDLAGSPFCSCWGNLGCYSMSGGFMKTNIQHVDLNGKHTILCV